MSDSGDVHTLPPRSGIPTLDILELLHQPHGRIARLRKRELLFMHAHISISVKSHSLSSRAVQQEKNEETHDQYRSSARR